MSDLFNKGDSGKFKKFRAASSPDDLLRAILMVHKSIEDEGDDPGAEKWTSQVRYREMLLEKTVKEWRKVTSLDQDRFYWNMDAITYLFIDVRKKGGLSRDKCSEQLGIA